MNRKGPQGIEEAIHKTLMLPVSAERAFDVFAKELGAWWPPEYTWSQDVLVAIAIEPGQDGHCYELGPHNFRCDWGRVLIWEPPHRLVFTWQISPKREPEPNPARASEIEVRFESDGPLTTRLEFEHRGFGRHGEDGAEYRAMLDSPPGWPYILNRYVKALA